MKIASLLLLLSLYTQSQTTLGSDFDLAYVSFTFDLRNANELTINYDVSAGATYVSNLYQKDCSTPISDLTITPTSAITHAVNATHARLVLEYDIDTPNLESSDIWNVDTSTIEVCQVVQLKHQTFVVAEDVRRIDFHLDLDVDIVVNEASGLIQMEDQASLPETGSADLTYAIKACKCSLDYFACNNDPLEPNMELNICLKTLSRDLLMERIELMVRYQNMCCLGTAYICCCMQMLARFKWICI